MYINKLVVYLFAVHSFTLFDDQARHLYPGIQWQSELIGQLYLLQPFMQNLLYLFSVLWCLVHSQSDFGQLHENLVLFDIFMEREIKVSTIFSKTGGG